VSIKRLKYFDHQFLREQDFTAEQAYHITMRRLHNRAVHGWGVVEGLEVHKKSERGIVVEPGIAIDGQGREIVLSATVIRDLSSFDRDSHTYITIAYDEGWDEGDRYASGGIDDYTRVTESPQISERKHEPAKDGSAITLARVHLNENGHVHKIDMDIRTSVGTRSQAAGWVRMPFKPVRMEPLRIGEKLVPPNKWDPTVEFTVDVASAYCEKSARGTMPIPIPPGATKIKAFRICGTTRGKVDIELVRGGWNPQAGTGERKIVLERSVQKEVFDEHVLVEEEDRQPLNEFHTLALSVIAEGRTEIWLVAVRFE